MTDYPKDKLFRIYAGDVGSDAYKHQYVEWLQQRLAAAEARADHVSFEHEVDTQQLEAKLAAAEALLRTASVSELVKRAVKEAENERQ